MACDQRELEGFLVPLGGLKLDPEDGMIDPAEFEAVFHRGKACAWGAANNALPAERFETLRQLVASVPYWTDGAANAAGTRQPIQLDETRREQLTEAWVPVLTAHGPGVLMWSNCD